MIFWRKLAGGAATSLAILANSAAAQIVWFSPQNPYPPAKISGASDFMDLFHINAPWEQASHHISVFKFSTQFLTWVADEQLVGIVQDLAHRRIALGMESLAQSVAGQPACGENVEGYGHPQDAAKIAAKIQRVGGDLKFIAMDEPLYYGHFYNGPNACHSSIANVAERVGGVLSEYRRVFPNVVIGDIEPFPSLSSQPNWQDDYANWVRTFGQTVGSPLSVLHIDVGWNAEGHETAIEAAVSAGKANGLKLGVIYNGNDNAQSDLEWLAGAKAHIAFVEKTLSIQPEHVVFQSWVRYPTQTMPETSETAFTHLINSYFLDSSR
jgi:hypothetical protein